MIELDNADRDIAKRALDKRRSGKRLTREENTILRRAERAADESNRWAHYRSIPQKHWIAMSGRPRKVLVEQADRYGIPFSTSVIDLPAVLKSFHDFLAKNKFSFGKDNDFRTRYDAARASKIELEIAERRGNVMQRDELQAGWQVIGHAIRRAGETLGRQFGADAQAILDETLAEADQTLARMTRRHNGDR